MAASITIRYYTNEETSNEQSYPMRVVADSATDMPTEIFVFQRRVDAAMDPEENDLGDLFVKIADAIDLEDYPTSPPASVEENPYYRVDEVTLYFRSYDELVETKTLMAACISKLVDSLKLADNLAEMDEVTYG